LLPADLSAELRQALSTQGVTWYFGTTVQSVAHQPDTSTLKLTLANGEVLTADLVLSAIGLRADLSLAQSAGLLCERGVVVNAQLQTSAEHIFALGDAAQYANGRTLPYVMPIMHAAKALASNLTGQATAVQFPLMPVAIKTPALPVTVAPPAPGTPGQWTEAEPGCWLFTDLAQVVRGFALSGAASSRRAEFGKRVVA
jgi:rubredoxin-NAD+ reductase